MKLIADSGSTKTHWLLTTNSGQCSEFFTDGINPVLQSEDAIYACISNQLLPQMANMLWVGPISDVFFYGAGCTPEKKVVVQQVIERIFKHAKVQVASDMLGAARGLFGHEKGVACILGTGSGSCFYDGEQIGWCVPSLGYVLGDEGSAATLGKRLVGDVFKNQLGADVKLLFENETGLNQADIIEHVYRQPFPNRWLANLARFCAEHLDIPAIRQLVYEHFESFVTRNLDQYESKCVGFVGSVAYYYREVLEEVLLDHGYTLSAILQDPIPGLKRYHT